MGSLDNLSQTSRGYSLAFLNPIGASAFGAPCRSPFTTSANSLLEMVARA
jgi:hypothetical protein